MESIKEKYRNNPNFHSLVDLMESLLLDKRLTFDDLYSAALAASMRYNQTKIDEIILIDQKVRDKIHEVLDCKVRSLSKDAATAAITYGIAFIQDGKIIPPVELYENKEDKDETN